jgi:ribosomal protein L28
MVVKVWLLEEDQVKEVRVAAVALVVLEQIHQERRMVDQVVTEQQTQSQAHL